MKVKELIELVNEQGKNIYRLSEAEGFSGGTLRNRLIDLGYKCDKRNKKWHYAGTNGIEPLDYELSYPSKKSQTTGTKKEYHSAFVVKNIDLFTALIRLPLENEQVTNSFKTDKALVDRMRTFIKQVSLPSGKIYSLAIYEFLEKYEPVLKELKKHEI